MKNYKNDFPIFKTKVNGKPLVYLDSAGTSQKPKAVVDAIVDYYYSYNANVRRGIYPMAEKATAKVEDVRKKIAKFINARHAEEIIFVRNSTEAINLVMNTWASQYIGKGDTIVTTIMEHHSNFVPWQQLALEKNAQLEVIDIDTNFQLRFNRSQFSIRQLAEAKILAISHVSNVLGTINPIKEIIKAVRQVNPKILVVVDGAQAVPHMKVDMQDLDADFYVFSGHKMLASTGIGVLYGKKKLLEDMHPFLFGSDMISQVSIQKTTFDAIPGKFEAGTPDIAGIMSMGVAIDYLQDIGMKRIRDHEQEITAYALEKMQVVEGMKVFGPQRATDRGGVISFTLDGIHPHDVAQYLGDRGICIRAGHHCAMPLHTRLELTATSRISFYLYNDQSDVDYAIKKLSELTKIFAKS